MIERGCLYDLLRTPGYYTACRPVRCVAAMFLLSGISSLRVSVSQGYKQGNPLTSERTNEQTPYPLLAGQREYISIHHTVQYTRHTELSPHRHTTGRMRICGLKGFEGCIFGGKSGEYLRNQGMNNQDA